MSEFDNIADDYEKRNRETLGVEDTEKFALYKIELAKKLCGDRKCILDFGCGTGRCFPYIQELFPNSEIYGCDVSEESLEVAKKYIARDHLFVNDTTNSIREHGLFDLVTAAGVFHHINPKERIDWFNGVIDSLKTAGCFLIFEHNLKNPITKKIVNSPMNVFDDENWMLSQKVLKGLSKNRSDIELVWTGYTCFSPWRTSWMTSAEILLKWLPLGAQHCVVFRKK